MFFSIKKKKKKASLTTCQARHTVQYILPSYSPHKLVLTRSICSQWSGFINSQRVLGDIWALEQLKHYNSKCLENGRTRCHQNASLSYRAHVTPHLPTPKHTHSCVYSYLSEWSCSVCEFCFSHYKSSFIYIIDRYLSTGNAHCTSVTVLTMTHSNFT